MPDSPPPPTIVPTLPLDQDAVLAAEAIEEARLLEAYLPKEVVSRVPLVLFLSIVFHVGLAVVLTQIPASRHLIERVITVQLVEKHKTPPKPPPPRPKREPRKTAPQQARQHPRPALAPREGGGPAGGTFGVEADDGGGGTFEVPVGDTLEAPSTSSAPAPPPPLVLDLSDDARGAVLDREPQPIGLLRVIYPEIARLATATGSALVEAYVEADGRVSRATLVRSSTGTFGKAALEAVRQTRFKPAVRKGVAVACSIRVPIAFELSAPVVVAKPTPIATLSVETPLAAATLSVASPSIAATESVQ